MTRDEVMLLGMATADTRKFALEVGLVLPEREQKALESLQAADHIRLLDVSLLSAHPGPLFRVFRITAAGEAALTAYRVGR